MELETQLCRTWKPVERERLQSDLVRVQERLDELQELHGRHQEGLTPRPSEVKTLLAGIVDLKSGRIRFQRVGREIALFQQRVHEGAQVLLARSDARLGTSARTLIDDVQAYPKAKPLSPSQHGLNEKARTHRWRAHARWLKNGEELLARIHLEMIAQPRPAKPSPPRSETLVAWLADVQDYFELGLFDRLGVIPGLKTRRGWRLDRLLRTQTGTCGHEPAPHYQRSRQSST
jgi:hypothetical protein